MLSYEEIDRIVGEITYKDWQFHLEPDGCGRVELQVLLLDEHAAWWAGRKWRLSPYMSRSEIVQTALLAVLTAEEHEAREQFRYRGRAVFGPHFDVDALAELCDRGALDVRAPAGGGQDETPQEYDRDTLRRVRLARSFDPFDRGYTADAPAGDLPQAPIGGAGEERLGGRKEADHG